MAAGVRHGGGHGVGELLELPDRHREAVAADRDELRFELGQVGDGGRDVAGATLFNQSGAFTLGRIDLIHELTQGQAPPATRSPRPSVLVVEPLARAQPVTLCARLTPWHPALLSKDGPKVTCDPRLGGAPGLSRTARPMPHACS